MTLNWPPAPPDLMAGHNLPASPEVPESADVPAPGRFPATVRLPSPLDKASASRPAAAATIGLNDPLLIAGVTQITEVIAAELHDGADPASMLPAVRSAAPGWLERQVRTGLLPASAGRYLDELVSAVHDQRYGLGPVTRFFRDPQVENVDINGCDEVWIAYATDERVAGQPVAPSDEALIMMIRSWAARGGQTARISLPRPVVNVALTGGARMTQPGP